MRWFLLCHAGCLAVVLTYQIGQCDEQPKELRLGIVLRDGSAIRGQPAESSSSFHLQSSEVAKLSWQQIDSISIADDKETAHIQRNNGEQLTGYFNVGALRIRTETKEQSIPIADMVSIHVGMLPTGPTRGLVACYAFDENTKDSSCLGHHGTLTGNAALGEDRSGQAKRSLNGNRSSGFMQIPDRNDLDTDEAFTLSAWVYPRNYFDVRGEDYSGFIVAKWQSSPFIGDYILRINSTGTANLMVSHSKNRLRLRWPQQPEGCA